DARRSAAVLRRARPIVVHDPSSPPRVSREPRRPDARWIAGGGAAGHSMVRRRAAPLRRHSLALSLLPRTFQPMIGMPRKQLWPLLAVILAAAPAAAQQPETEYRGATALGLALRRLGPTQRVLMIAAHPDDENTSVLATLALGGG